MNQDDPPRGPSFCGRTRREFLWEAGAGFTALGLVDLLSRDGLLSKNARAASASTNPLAPKPPHFEVFESK